MSKTQENLKTAFAGESQANRRYLAFAKKAEAEGKNNLAKLFRNIAESETVHALNHLAITGSVLSSKENIEAALSGESYEFDKMYPQFINEAMDEDESMAVKSFTSAKKVEEVHCGYLKKALDSITDGKDIEEEKYVICPVCGNLIDDPTTDPCPVCGTAKEKFYAIN